MTEEVSDGRGLRGDFRCQGEVDWWIFVVVVVTTTSRGVAGVVGCPVVTTKTARRVPCRCAVAGIAGVGHSSERSHFAREPFL